MRNIRFVYSVGLLAILFLTVHSFRGSKTAIGAAVSGVFEGTSPGVTDARSFLKIPAAERCDFIRWKLTLFHDAQTKAPTTYKLEREYGFYVDNRTDKSMGQTTIEGKWGIVKGANSKAGGVVYRLYSDQYSISFLQVDNNLLHLLDNDKSLMVGNGGQSFTLSRTGKVIPPMSIYQTLQTSAELTSGIKDTVLDFVGRTPCTAISKELNLPADASCFKIKWSLKLYQDPVTFKPTTYKLNRVFHRQNIIEGSWTIVKGTATDPNAIIYILDPYKRDYTLYLLKGDDNVLFFLNKERNHLVGDSLFSYTLNRRKP